MVEELAEEGEPAVIGRRQAFIRRHVGQYHAAVFNDDSVRVEQFIQGVPSSDNGRIGIAVRGLGLVESLLGCIDF